MTGFTLGGGQGNGATLGGPEGGTLGTSPTSWQLDGQPIPTIIEETRSYQSLTLRFRVQTSVLLDRLRGAKASQGQVEVSGTDSGGYRAVDRAGGANTYELTPPESRRPLRRQMQVHVARYEEELVSQEVEEWDVEVEFTPARPRGDQPTIRVSEQVPETNGGEGGTLGGPTGFTLGGSAGASLGSARDVVPPDYWKLDTRLGTLATDRVSADFLGTGADGVERFELSARLTARQARVLEASLSRLGGARVKRVPDGENRVLDETPEGANTIGVRSPTEDVVETGDYVALGWESRRLNDAFQEVSLEVARSRD